MYLSDLRVVNFRCLEDVLFQFRPGLNLLLGENNAGKSAMVDALRLLFSAGPALGPRDIWPRAEDIHHDASGAPTASFFELHGTFRDLSLRERGLYSLCLSPSEGPDVASLHIRYEAKGAGGSTRGAVHQWGGETETGQVPGDVLASLRHVYLEPLRDAELALRPGRGSRIARLLDLLATGDAERAQLESHVADANSQIERHDLVTRTSNALNDRLGGVTGPHLAQRARLDFAPPQFRRIAEALRVLVGADLPAEVSENGLGYNNLLYIAAVLSELQQAKCAQEIDLAALVIEEPEAHLHPHLQSVLVTYLQEIADGVRLPPPTPGDPKPGLRHAGEAGRDDSIPPVPVQVFVTSHSPVVASHLPLDSISVLYTGRTPKLGCYPLAQCDLSDGERRFLERFLDVTKAQLFFGRGVILVEGISEALLLPEFARSLACPLDQYGVSVVNVQSTSFRAFAKLFGDGALDIRAALVTDADPPSDVFPTSLDTNRLSPTAAELRGMATPGGALRVYLASKTLEYDLALAGNAQRMAEAYSLLRPQKGRTMLAQIGAQTSDHDRARCFLQQFDPGDKAELAQRLASEVGTSPLGVPGYLQDAIRWATGTGGDE